MPQFTSYPPNTPCWVDLATSDVEGAKEFYAGMFGWTAETILDPEAQGYTMFLKDGLQVATVSKQQVPGAPSAWNTYISVTDADKTAQLVEEAGGRVLAEPMDVMGQGRMAVFMDSTGAAISVWQPMAMHGAQLATDPDTWSWNELQARDTAEAEKFYRSVFDWDASTTINEGMPYTQFDIHGRVLAGMMPMPPEMPAEVPPHWLVYFNVTDIDAAFERGEELGAQPMLPPMATPVGPIAMVSDPQGATFAFVQLSQEQLAKYNAACS